MEIKFIETLKIDTSEYWNWIKNLFPKILSNKEVFDKWMPEARIYTYRFLKLRGYKNNNPMDSGLRDIIDDVAQYITKLFLKS